MCTDFCFYTDFQWLDRKAADIFWSGLSYGYGE